MLKISALAVATLFATLTASAQANDAIVRSNNQATLQLGANHLDYKEYDRYDSVPGNVLDSEKGSQTSLKLGAITQRSILGVDNIVLSGSLGYTDGNTDYSGFLQNTSTGEILGEATTSTKNRILNFDIKAGRAFKVAADAQVTPYVGYGYRHWVRNIQGEYGLKETYKHHTASVGVLGQYAVSPKLVASADYSFGRTFSGKMDVSGEDLNFKLGRENSQTLGVGLDYALTKDWHLNTTYQVTKFKYGESPVVAGFIEPDSKTVNQALYVGAGFRF